MEKFLLSLLCLLTVGFAGQAAEKTIVIDCTKSNSGITFPSNGYGETTYTDATSGITIKGRAQKNNGLALQSNGGYICVTQNSNLFAIKSISVKAKTGASKTTTLSAKASENPYTFSETNKTDWTGSDAGSNNCTTSESTFSYQINNSFAVLFNSTNGGMITISMVTITYDDGTSEGPELEANGLAYPQDAYTATLGEEFESPVLTNPNNLSVTYSSSNEKVATVDAEGNVTLVAAGTTVIKADFIGDDTYKAGVAEYTLTVKDAPIIDPDGTFTFDFVNNNYGMTRHDSKSNEYNDSPITIKNEDNGIISINVVNSAEGKQRLFTDGWRFHRGKKVSGNYTFCNYTMTISIAKEYRISEISMIGKLLSSTKASVNCEGLEYTKTGTGDNATLTWKIDNKNDVIFTISTSDNLPIAKIVVKYEPAPAAPAVPEIVCEHEIVDGKLTVKAESTSMNFKKVEGIDIYYRLNGGKDKPATRACEDVAHSSWILHQGEDITLTNNHTLLEYLACNPETGVHSETKTIALEVGATGVAEIEAAEAGEVRWFDMQGREVKGQPAAGVYVRVANGKAAKVIVK